MQKIAILGKTGMLGCQVYELFSKSGFEIVATTRDILEAQNASVEEIEQLLNSCDYAINCIGIIKPYIHDDNSFEVQRAIKVNGLFPHKLAEASKKTNTKVIQIATDCVYDGVEGNYNESAKHNAVDVYGKTKSLGEVAADNFLNLRCSIIGREKKGYLSLLEWFLRQPEKAQVSGFRNHCWNGVTTDAFAKICLGIIKNDAFFAGVQHVIPSDTLTKAQMLRVFANHFDRQDVLINDIDAKDVIDRTLSTLNFSRNQQLWQNAGYKNIPSVEEMINGICKYELNKIF